MAAHIHLVYKCFLLFLVVSPLIADKENVPAYEENPSNTWRKIGEEKVEQIRREAQHSTCWKEALVSLETSCKNLSDTSQSRLALSFANCHLERSGRRTYPCLGGQSIRDCTSPNVMDNFAFQTYTEFFTHSSHMCFYLQSTLWRERTERTINDLGKTSTEVVNKLEESLDYHKKMETLQSTSLSNQRDILSHEQKIASSIQDGHTKFSNYFEEVIEKAERQKLLLDSIFSSLNKGLDGIQWFLTNILGEVMSFGTILFFFLTLVFLTLLPQFGRSRLLLYITLFIYVIFERGLVKIFIWYYGLQSTELMPSLHTVLWYSRSSFVFLIFPALYLWCYLVYSDMQSKQLKLLEGIQEQLHLLKDNWVHDQINPYERIEFDGANPPPPPPLSPPPPPPPGVPLSSFYSNDPVTHDEYKQIKSGTQLLDFLSSIYVKRGMYDTAVTLESIDDDATYQPDGHIDTIEEQVETDDESSPSLLHSSLSRPPLSHSPHYNLTPHRRHGIGAIGIHQEQGQRMNSPHDDSGINDDQFSSFSSPTTRYNLRPRRSTPRRI